MKIAVIGAMDVEVENLKTTLNLKKKIIMIFMWEFFAIKK